MWSPMRSAALVEVTDEAGPRSCTVGTAAEAAGVAAKTAAVVSKAASQKLTARRAPRALRLSPRSADGMDDSLGCGDPAGGTAPDPHLRHGPKLAGTLLGPRRGRQRAHRPAAPRIDLYKSALN